MTKRLEVYLILGILVMLFISYRSISENRLARAEVKLAEERVEKEAGALIKAREAGNVDLEALKEEQKKVNEQLQKSKFISAQFVEREWLDDILELIRTSGAQLLLFQRLGKTGETVGKGSYTAYKYKVKARGTPEQIKQIIENFGNFPYLTYKIDLLKLAFSKGTWDTEFQVVFLSELSK